MADRAWFGRGRCGLTALGRAASGPGACCADDELGAALDDCGNTVRDPTFPDIPTFKEVCEATPVCSTEGEVWDAWKAFFIAGFPEQKMVFLTGSASPDVVATYENAFNDIKARPDFAEISAKTLGIYPQMTGAAADKAKALAAQVPAEAKAFVINWLEEDYGVSLK